MAGSAQDPEAAEVDAGDVPDGEDGGPFDTRAGGSPEVLA